MVDERNFRSSYYDKVGFRGVEEKKSLEILLKDRPYDKVKLKQFCLRFTVPAMYRNFLWKILLGVVPVYESSNDYIMTQRRSEFEDLQKALKDAKIIDQNTKPYQTFVTMWLLRTRRAKIDLKAQLESQLLKSMSKMAKSLWNIINMDEEKEKVDIYWVLSGFLDHIQKFHKEVPRLHDYACSLLERDDTELYNHLLGIDALQNLPYETWFYSCFAEVISDRSITKIWDKIAVGAYKILVFVEITMLTTLRRVLLRCTTVDCVIDATNNITHEMSEVIVNKAIDLHQSGSALVPAANVVTSVFQST